MPKRKKLTDAEAGILTNALARRNGSVIPLPKEYDIGSAEPQKLIKRLLAIKLIEERATVSLTSAWRTDDAGRHYSLRISAAGRTSLPAEQAVDGLAEPETSSSSEHSGPVRPRGKLGAVLTAVCRPEGAALDELATLTGWQKHTVRACITRLRQTGFAIAMASTALGKRYVTSADATGGAK